MCNWDAVQAALKARGIPTAVHNPLPLNRQPAADPDAHLPAVNAAATAAEVLSPPMHPDIDAKTQTCVVDALAAAFRAGAT